MQIRQNVHIGNVIRNALAFKLKNWSEGPLKVDGLFQAVPDLFALLEERGIKYVLVGGVALLQYVEGRNTEDIDLIMAVSELKKVPEIKITDQETYFARGQYRELQIDLFLTRNRLFDLVQKRYTTPQRFVEQEIPCATVEGLLLLKLYALPSLYRQGNFARVGVYENDIATLLNDYQPELAPLLAELSRHLSATDLAAVKDIIAEIRQRIDRFRRGLQATE